METDFSPVTSGTRLIYNWSRLDVFYLCSKGDFSGEAGSNYVSLVADYFLFVFRGHCFDGDWGSFIDLFKVDDESW